MDGDYSFFTGWELVMRGRQQCLSPPRSSTATGAVAFRWVLICQTVNAEIQRLGKTRAAGEQQAIATPPAIPSRTSQATCFVDGLISSCNQPAATQRQAQAAHVAKQPQCSGFHQ